MKSASSTQLPLLTAVSSAPTLAIRGVPPDVAIAPNRYQICASHEKGEFCYGIQLLEIEALALFPDLKKLDWHTCDNNSSLAPIEIQAIHRAYENFIDGRLR